jgi:hypothetical protein
MLRNFNSKYSRHINYITYLAQAQPNGHITYYRYNVATEFSLFNHFSGCWLQQHESSASKKTFAAGLHSHPIKLAYQNLLCIICIQLKPLVYRCSTS